MSAMTGRGRFTEILSVDGQGPAQVSFDPVFTLLDVMIDPAYYADRPLIGINYLPLRQRVLEVALADRPEQIERWKRTGRVSPRMIQSHLGGILERYPSDGSTGAAVEQVQTAMSLYLNGWGNLMMVPPAEPDGRWEPLAALPGAGAGALAQLAAGWRELDALRVNAAAASLAGALGSAQPGVYPGARRSLEILYNRSAPFEWGAWLYALSLVALLVAMGTARRWLMFAGLTALGAGLTVHAAGFAARCVIAERYSIQNQFESMTGVSLFAALLAVVLTAARRQAIFAAAAAGVGFLVLLTATQAGIPGQTIAREAAILNTSVLLKYHVTTVLLSYGLIALGMIVSVFYLGAYYLRGGVAALAGAGLGDTAGDPEGFVPERSAGLARVLHDLDKAQLTVLQLAFWTLGSGIMLGAWWADHAWGRWWGFDPKETWALITWIVYLIVVHLRVATTARRGVVTAWLSVAGFVVMVWTYFGVNLLLSGLHAYA
ncbi:MAG: hypothetical protein C0475_06565 [Planctomyces sp.]|nr:hypothetical protein [Planctomyces sp.]MBA4120089.1 hypothetical protein [Isosphaera sp.]